MELQGRGAVHLKLRGYRLWDINKLQDLSQSSTENQMEKKMEHQMKARFI